MCAFQIRLPSAAARVSSRNLPRGHSPGLRRLLPWAATAEGSRRKRSFSSSVYSLLAPKFVGDSVAVCRQFSECAFEGLRKGKGGAGTYWTNQTPVRTKTSRCFGSVSDVTHLFTIVARNETYLGMWLHVGTVWIELAPWDHGYS